ncbi:glutathione peroxidase [Neisseria animalis]|uniref:Glutathione peroxidase n=1 Tax=Neisseria animalis TaxID=492 RepID=A0A5P3MS02_NEIAN|nr:glutathione peroxidase [Neisseria animalis]QEY24386.1 glutathione peroxidase [Neisseria animalis]ROW31444.1 glutathione peroxidase [Neisseria animalis]VEE06932.1 glutathione peroxidase [Neisseria animalis]
MTLYDFTVKDTQGNNVSLADYRGKVLLIVNTATRCGLTPQYEELQAMYDKYAEQGFEILDFPCNQFREQAPESSEEIAQVCQMKFGTKFKIFDKIDVNGAHTAPLYAYLKTQKTEDQGNHTFKDLLLKLASLGEKREGSDIKWNFTKFLINRNGEVVERFAPSVKPSEIESDIQALL